MRGRSIRLFILILFILGLSVAALAFTNVNISLPGFPDLNRGGAGPLGLKLGLDLSGGGHLVYQADTGSRIEVVFTEPAEASVIEEALDDLAVADYEVQQRDVRSYLVTTGLLDEATKESLQTSLIRNAVDVEFNQELDLTSLSGITGVVEDLELASFQVGRQGEGNSFRITTTTPLDDELRQELKIALAENVGEIVEFAVTGIGVESYAVTETFSPDAEQMEGVLNIISQRINLFGADEPIIQLFGSDRIIVQLPGASGSITAVEFSEPTGVTEVNGILQAQGFEDFSVDQSGNSGREFELRTVSLNVNQQQALRNDLAVGIGAINSFQTTGGIETAKALIGQTAQLVFKERTCTDRTCRTFTDAEIGLTGDDLASAYASTDQNTGEWAVNIAFNDRGSGIFADLTQRIVDLDTKRIAVFLDDDLLIAPVSLAWIRDGRSVITGNFSREEAPHPVHSTGIRSPAGAPEADSGERRGCLARFRVPEKEPGCRHYRPGAGADIYGRLLPHGRRGGRPGPGVLHRRSAGGVQAGAGNPGPLRHWRFHPVHRSGGGRQYPDI